MTQTIAQSGAATQFPSVGRWTVTAMPSGWIYIADFGIRQIKIDTRPVPASVGIGQDTLTSETGFAEYIEKQMKLIGGHLVEPKFAGPQPTAFPGADEAQLIFVRHNADSVGTILHAQTYVRSGLWLGIITLTTLEEHLRTVRPDYDVFVKGLRIRQLQTAESATQSATMNTNREGA